MDRRVKTVYVNKVYGQLRRYDKRYFVNYGGRRSGKSVAISQLLVRRAIDHPGRRIMVLRKVGTTVRHSVLPRMKAAVDEIIGLENVTVRLVDREIHFQNGSVIGFGSLDDVEKWKSAEGIHDYWLEEASEMSIEDFNTLDAGLSTPCDPQPSIWLSFNPIPLVRNSKHWLQERFLDIEHKLEQPAETHNSVVLRTWFRSNKWCPQPTVDLLLGYRKSNPELWKMWGLGEFTTLKGAILTNWDIVAEVPEGIPFAGYGLDFGFAEDPAAFIAVWAYRDEIWLQQKVYATGLTNQELSSAMQEAGAKKGLSDIVGDSAEPKSIEELRKDGWIIRGSEKSPDYKRAAAMYLRGKTIHCLEDSPDLIKELGSWSWKQDRNGNVLPVVGDGHDHGIDAVIYRVFTRETAIAAEHVLESRTEDAPAFGSVIDSSIPVLEVVHA